MIPKFFLALLVCTLTLLVGELGIRAVWGAPAWTDRRVVFFSTETWQRDAMGAMRYKPSTTIRTVAIYGDRVEYDARFPVNNLGFVDRIDYGVETDDREQDHIAFVGDSFTAGFHGSDPWVPRLRDRARELQPGIQIYNLGIGAVGVHDFTRLAKSASEELNFQKIVFLLLTNDLYRRQWLPVERDGFLYLCPENPRGKACPSGRSRILVLPDNDLSIEELLSIIEERKLIAPVEGVVDWWTRNTFIGSNFRPLLFHDLRVKPPKPKPAALEKYLVRWLREIQIEFRDKEVVLIHLPTKADVLQGHFDIDVASQARSFGIEYISLLERCDFGIDDFYPIDGHPNDRGYQKFLECVGAALDLI